MPRRSAQQNELPDQRRDKGDLIPFTPAPEAESDPLQPDLGPLKAARLEAWCRVYGLPASTLRAIIAHGQGPDTFRLGKLVYIARDAWEDWLAEQAAKGGTGRLSPPSGRTPKVALPEARNSPAPLGRVVPQSVAAVAQRQPKTPSKNAVPRRLTRDGAAVLFDGFEGPDGR